MNLCLFFRCQGIFFAPDLPSTKDYKYTRRTWVSTGPFMLCSISMLFFCFHGLLPPISNVAPSHRDILAVINITRKLKLVCFPQPNMMLDILMSLQHLYIFFCQNLLQETNILRFKDAYYVSWVWYCICTSDTLQQDRCHSNNLQPLSYSEIAYTFTLSFLSRIRLLFLVKCLIITTLHNKNKPFTLYKEKSIKKKK